MDLLLGRCWVSCIDLNLNTHARVYTMAKESGQAPVQRSHKLHTALLEKDENQNGLVTWGGPTDLEFAMLYTKHSCTPVSFREPEKCRNANNRRAWL